jgi:hypothetical protein
MAITVFVGTQEKSYFSKIKREQQKACVLRQGALSGVARQGPGTSFYRWSISR